MKEIPGVSIVIPNYNYARFVGAAIESALAQDHAYTEVIVVDDGSTDDSRVVIARFGERVRAVCQANQGHVEACNAGWRLARHEIVIFLDSDDLLMPHAACTVAAAWRPGVSKLQWVLQVVDDEGRAVGISYPKYPGHLTPQMVRDQLLQTGGYPCPPTSGNAYARALLEVLSPIEGHRWMDPLLTSVAPLYGDVLTIDRPLGAYRCHDANGTEQSRVTADRFERYLEDEEARFAFLARCCTALGHQFEPSRAKARNMWYQEVQLLAAKLRGSRSAPRAWRAILAILGSAQSPWQRSIRTLWIALIALLPLPLARLLIEMRFVPVRRPRVIEIVVRAFEHRQPGGDQRNRRAHHRACHQHGGQGLMSELPGVSIVIPNYNYARFVSAAIESALAQDHPEIEVIVVDDGSTDGSRQVIAGFGDRICPLLQPNQGHVAACTNGWRRARHDIIIFLDSDDMLRPDAASSVVRAWRPGISKVQWCLAVVDAEGRELGHVFPKYPSPLEPESVRRELLRVGNYPAARTSGNAYAREFLEAFGEVEGDVWMDSRLNAAAPLYGDVVTLHRALTFYRVHGDNAWAHLSAAQLAHQVDFARRHCAYLARCCARVGVDFDAERALQRNLWHHQDRLVLAKLQMAAGTGYTAVRPLLRAMLGANLRSTEPLWQRLAVAGWAVLVAAAPPSWSRALINLRYEPTQRPSWLHKLAEHIGRRRRTRGLRVVS